MIYHLIVISGIFIISIFLISNHTSSKNQEKILKDYENVKLCAFFHPNWYTSNYYIYDYFIFSDAAGGGERVLWEIIKVLQKKQAPFKWLCIIYTETKLSKKKLINQVKVYKNYLFQDIFNFDIFQIEMILPRKMSRSGVLILTFLLSRSFPKIWTIYFSGLLSINLDISRVT